ncbi:MAG: histidine kinase dimerization/phosphoacceptor domain-containing protein [Marmoricola sp.]|nr:histidine kinase dimerization/phosphoacceptor domain-containing protein [Marmoricola sp.]
MAFAEYSLTQRWDDGHRAGAGALNAVLVAVAVLPMAWRRTYPRLALIGMVAATGLPGLVVDHDYLFWAGFLPILLMVHTTARLDDGAVGAGAWLAAPILLALEGVTSADLRTLNEVAFGMTAFVTAWAIGRGLNRLDRQERELSTALAQLEEQRPMREAAAVGEERTRIAGEMHDVVTHAVSLMTLQVGAARLEVETAGPSALAAGQLRAAEHAGRDALDQLRRSLTVLRGAGP